MNEEERKNAKNEIEISRKDWNYVHIKTNTRDSLLQSTEVLRHPLLVASKKLSGRKISPLIIP